MATRKSVKKTAKKTAKKTTKKTTKKAAKKAAKKSVKKTTSKITIKDTADAIRQKTGYMSLSDFAQSTKAELLKLGDRIHEAADKGINVMHDIADDVHSYAKNTTDLTKLKIELHNLKEERTKLYSLMGEQLRNLYVTKKLSGIKTRMKADFARLDELEASIDEKQKLAAKLSLSK